MLTFLRLLSTVVKLVIRINYVSFIIIFVKMYFNIFANQNEDFRILHQRPNVLPIHKLTVLTKISFFFVLEEQLFGLRYRARLKKIYWKSEEDILGSLEVLLKCTGLENV